MSITGFLPATAIRQPYTDNIASGPVQFFSAYGFRAGVAVIATGVDIWSGVANVIPIPPLAGEQMSIVSTSAQDGVAGTGVLTLEVLYVDDNGVENVEIITTNGLAAVNTVAVNIRFVNDLYALTAGATKAAVGTITIFPVGVPATVYTQIDPGKTRHINTSRMVPANKILLVESFDSAGASAVGAQSVDVRLRSTSRRGLPLTVTPPTTLFNSHDNLLVFNTIGSQHYETPIIIPSLAIVKTSAFALGAGQDIQASWHGKLVTTPV